MGREWKRGDLALVEVDGTQQVGVRSGSDSNPGWWCPHLDHPRTTGVWSSDVTNEVEAIRPLVVIDPESIANDVPGRLAADIVFAAASQLEREEPRADKSISVLYGIAAALDAALTPPKPDEPMGLGAVVEDADGVRWTRANAAGEWFSHNGNDVLINYDEVAAVRVLSEGVA